MTEKTVNYTPDQVVNLVANYTAGMPVDMIAREMGKSVRSIVAKLSREGVYIKPQHDRAARVTKAMLIAKIAEKHGVSASQLESLEKASKDALEILAV